MKKGNTKKEKISNMPVQYLGLDVHRDTISIAVASAEHSPAQAVGVIANDSKDIRKFFRRRMKQAELRVVYEAGGCGYVIQRLLSDMGIDCMVVAPSLIPRHSGMRVKTDKRDAQALATLHRSGMLTAVWVPDQWQEGLRDLTRARGRAKRREKQQKQELVAFCLRNGQKWPGKSRWTKDHWAWLRKLRFDSPSQTLVLEEYLDAITASAQRVARLDRLIRDQSRESRGAHMIASLMALRGISHNHAASLVAELGDIRRFSRAEQLMGYVGLVPSEHSSGQRSHRGRITKTGNRQVRSLLIQAAQSYNVQARRTAVIAGRQKDLSQEVCDLSWEAQTRLTGRYRRLLAEGKHANKVKTAVARELCGFIWAIAQVSMTEIQV